MSTEKEGEDKLDIMNLLDKKSLKYLHFFGKMSICQRNLRFLKSLLFIVEYRNFFENKRIVNFFRKLFP